ncbi:SurA N-terminal domain-containing protein [Thermodesulfobacteriota bacterium]
MTRWAYNLAIWLGVLVTLYALTACSDSKSRVEKEYIVRVGDRVLTVLDFNKAFEIVKAAYHHNAMQDPKILREARLRLLNQMTEEMIIMKRAQELGIEISKEEVDKAIANIKADYPEEVFQETLLENAIPYNSWEQGVKNRLLIKKVVDKELAEHITITPDEISEYYKENYQGEGLTSDFEDRSININEVIIKNVRRNKLEAAYKSWIQELRKKYPIEINRAKLGKIVAS